MFQIGLREQAGDLWYGEIAPADRHDSAGGSRFGLCHYTRTRHAGSAAGRQFGIIETAKVALNTTTNQGAGLTAGPFLCAGTIPGKPFGSTPNTPPFLKNLPERLFYRPWAVTLGGFLSSCLMRGRESRYFSTILDDKEAPMVKYRRKCAVVFGCY
jgi:hypothetical protein